MRLEQLKTDYYNVMKICFAEANWTSTLRDYIKQNCEKGFFEGFGNRLLLAHELLRCCNDMMDESSRRKVAAFKQVAFFNVDNLSVQEILSEGKIIVSIGLNHEDIVKSIEASSLHKRSIRSIKKFFNYQFADQGLIHKLKGDDGKVLWASNDEIYDNFCELQVCRTISTILFFLLFGVHPLFGRGYYEKPNLVDEHDETLFFIGNSKPIFQEIEYNSNRFINGYHEEPWELWKNLSERQVAFFTDAFADKFTTFKQFYKNWKDAFDSRLVKAKAKCGEGVDALLFRDGWTLLLTQRSCGKSVRCRNFRKDMKNICEKCKVPNEERSASLLWVQAYLHDKSKQPTFSKSLILHEGGVLRNCDVHDCNSDTVLFECGTSKNKEKFGIKCKTSGVEIVTENGNKPFKIDEIEPIAPRLKIKIDQHKTLEIC